MDSSDDVRQTTLSAVADFMNQAVRPVVAFAFTGAFIYLAVTAYVPADAFNATAGIVIAWYFAQRAQEKIQDQIQRRQEKQFQEVVQLAKQTPPER